MSAVAILEIMYIRKGEKKNPARDEDKIYQENILV